jgi:hypothetical protein
MAKAERKSSCVSSHGTANSKIATNGIPEVFLCISVVKNVIMYDNVQST